MVTQGITDGNSLAELATSCRIHWYWLLRLCPVFGSKWNCLSWAAFANFIIDPNTQSGASMSEQNLHQVDNRMLLYCKTWWRRSCCIWAVYTICCYHGCCIIICSRITNHSINVVDTVCDCVMMLIALCQYQLVRWGSNIGVWMHQHVDSIWNAIHLSCHL